MSAKPSGYGSMQFGGQDRPFQVGTNQGDIFCRLPHRRGDDGKPMSLVAFSELFGIHSLQAQSLTGGDLRDFVFSALAAGYENDGLRVDFTPQNVGNWIDEPDTVAEEVTKPITAMLEQMVRRAEHAAQRAKNAPAPTPAKAKGPKASRRTA